MCACQENSEQVGEIWQKIFAVLFKQLDCLGTMVINNNNNNNVYFVQSIITQIRTNQTIQLYKKGKKQYKALFRPWPCSKLCHWLPCW